MSFMVSDLLDYAQIKAGKFRKNIKLFNIRDAVCSVVSILEQKANELKLEIHVNFENICPTCDPDFVINPNNETACEKKIHC